MFIEKRKQGNNIKYYLTQSKRQGKKVIKTRKYLGANLNEKQLNTLLTKEQFQENNLKNLESTESKTTEIKKLRTFPISIVEKTNDQFNKSFHAKVFTLFASTHSQAYTFSKRCPLAFKFCFCFLKNDEAQWFLDRKRMLTIRTWIKNKSKTSTSEVFKIYKHWKKNWENYTKLANELLKKDLKKLDNEELYDLFEEFYKQYLLAGSIAYICDSFMSTGAEDWLEEEIKSELKQKTNKEILKAVRTLTSPVHLSFTLEAEYQLLKTTEKILEKYPNNLPTIHRLKKEHPKLFALLEKHEKEFYWVQNNYYNVRFLDVEYTYEQMNKIIKDAKENKTTIEKLRKEKQKELKFHKEKRQSLLNTLKLSNYMKNILKIARLFSKWKDIRKGGVYIGMQHFDKFLEEVANRTQYTKRQLTYSIFPEIKPILLNKIDIKEELAKREKKTFFAVTDKGYFITAGKKADKYFDEFNKIEEEYVVELRGVVASSGYARGRVRIIKKTEQMKDFKTGEILVVNQTTPEFVPIMKKAAAIITEQGGITSHASIISRELKKPCIIGTKIATRALMNGETVEVDARNGIVRRER
jgi:phosphoenolpyruvate synthase/pyruvate phosphate dikinase